MGKSKRAKAFELFKFSDPSWDAVVIPVAGCSEGSAVVASRVDPYTGRRMYGRCLAQYTNKTVAERLATDLNAHKRELLANAFP